MLSLVLPLHSARRQAERVLASLSPPYQEPLGELPEILVVETPSDDELGEERACNAGKHVRYLALEEGVANRVRSLEAGLREARGPFVGLFVDAAHIVTPRAIGTALQALSLDNRALVVLPEYRFDEERVPGAGSTEAEHAFLGQSQWRKNPYDLFSSARFGPSNPNGCLSPLLGAACLFARKNAFAALGALDARLDVPGAAALKLWMYTELARAPRTRLVVLPGEGAFRQHHAELEDEAVVDAEKSMQQLVFSAVSALPGFRAVHREPLAFGYAPGPSLRFLAESAALADYHGAACRARGEASWYEDPTPSS